jgi:ABC-type glycerol-3-phosphate transport system permease component
MAMTGKSEILRLSAALAVSAVVLFPLAWMVGISFKPDTEQFAYPPTLIPSEFVLDNYKRLISDTNFPRYIFNSLLVAVATVILALAIGSPAAYAMARFRILSSTAITSSILLVYMFPPILLGIPLFVIFSQLRLSDTYLGLILAHTTFALPFVVWMMKDFFQAVPIEIEEAALVDGCSRARVLRSIALPVVRPGLIASGIFVFLLSWSDYVYALILMTSEGRKTISLALNLFIDSTTVEPGLMMAASVLITVPVLICFMFVQRYLVQGLAVGAVR